MSGAVFGTLCDCFSTRPCFTFGHLSRGGGGGRSLLGVSKLGVGALCNKDQRIGLDEYLRLMAYFCPS